MAPLSLRSKGKRDANLRGGVEKADFSTARRTIRLCAASVEMTVLWSVDKSTDNRRFWGVEEDGQQTVLGRRRGRTTDGSLERREGYDNAD